jgi:hypothetical protein
LESVQYFKEDINITYPSRKINVFINYPLKDLLIAEQGFNPIELQQCLDNADCSNKRQLFDGIIASCISSLDLNGFRLRNSSVPLLVGNQIYTGLEICDNGITVLLPFNLGIYSFFC